MKTNFTSFFRAGRRPFEVVCAVGVILLSGVLAGSAQTGDYLYSGTEETITLNAGTYDIAAYGAQGGIGEFGSAGGFGAGMSGQFSFSGPTTLTLLVGGVGGNAPLNGNANATAGGGGGGSFVVYGATPLVIAGGGGGGGGVGTAEVGGSGGTGQSGEAGAGFAGGAGGSNGGGGNPGTDSGTGGGGGGFYSSGGSGYFDGGGGGSYLSGGVGGSGIYQGYLIGGFGGYGGGAGGGYGYGGAGGGGGYSGGGGSGGDGTYSGGGGGSIIDPSVITILSEVSGVSSPNGSPNGEIIITATPEPSIPVLLGIGIAAIYFLKPRTKPRGA
jgi:hypothetical protein